MFGDNSDVNKYYGYVLDSTHIYYKADVGGDDTIIFTTQTLNNNTWYHLVFVREDEVMNAYVNGLKATPNTAFTNNIANSFLLILFV